MLQKYVRYCTKKVLDAVNIGTMELVNMKRNVFTPEFILLGLLVQDDSSVVAIAEELRLDSDEVKKRLIDGVYTSVGSQVSNYPVTDNVQLVVSSEVESVFEIAPKTTTLN